MAKNTLLFSFKSTNVCLVLFTGDKAKFNARKAFYLAKIPTTPLDVFLSEDPLLRKILAIFMEDDLSSSMSLGVSRRRVQVVYENWEMVEDNDDDDGVPL